MSTRDEIIAILRDTSVVTVTALVEYVEAQRADVLNQRIGELLREAVNEQAVADVRELIAEQVTTLAPDESGRISKGLALAYILGELDATIAREEKP